MRNGLRYPSLKRITELALLLFSGLFFLSMLSLWLLDPGRSQAPCVDPAFTDILFRLLLLALLLNILVQTYGAVTEGTSLLEPCPEAEAMETGHEYRTHFHGAMEPVLLSFRNFLEEAFSRFSSFQTFHAPHLFFCYFAKRGCLSLFSAPWIKTGFLFFLLFAFGWLDDARPRPVSSEHGIPWTLLAVLCFWLPGIVVRFSHPYQKLWLCATQEGGTLYVRVHCRSPLRKARLGGLLKSTKRVLTHVDGCGAVSSSIQ